MDHFITNIRVNKVFHLEGFDIPISETEKKHLIITGKNGSGKTVLLNAMAECINVIGEGYVTSRDFVTGRECKISSKGYINSEKIELSFHGMNTLIPTVYNGGTFIRAYYADERKSLFKEHKDPIKPNLTKERDIRRSKVDQFLAFMVDYKVQEALAQIEGKNEDVAVIRQWFDSFRDILRLIFDDEELNLDFNYKDYSFQIQTQGKSFKFTQLSAGYSAALDIVTDLILKMQTQDGIVRAYEKQGIVLIDEIETHLHLELQRVILPILTSLFPHIQFIVTTHSPFVLNSLENAVAFDLERREPITDLTDYSYEALAEGYFGVRTESSELQQRLQRMKELIDAAQLSVSEEKELEMYLADFDKIPEAIAPTVKAQYYELNREWNNKRGVK